MSEGAARRVVVTDYTFPNLDRERLAAEKLGASFEAHQCRTAAEVASAIAGADVAVVQFAPCGAEAIAGLAPGATLLRYGIGYDNIDVAAAAARSMPVGYVPDYCIDEVADHTVALMLSSLRKLPGLDASLRAGRWEAVAAARPLKPFAETVVGFLGFGQIGREICRRLKPFGFQFIVADPMLDDAKAAELGVRRVDVGTLFREADALSLNAPATPETTGIVNAGTLKTMKSNAVIVNTARGKLVNEPDLAAALTDGVIAGAGLDVFETEPLPADSPLRQAPNLILTPHAAWYSEAAIGRLQQLIADDIGAALSGARPRRPVPGSA
ncbi:C-terminal binding protein [Arvimicrobium flavum]|uniref:C-terminal binding protein n=1 Tax=Arvimicrobium flavum TaxID=3393320 RepID=UPI00237A59EB|nr:C-terminal binding protein [Mesorhizobium shangrilense]